MTTAKYLTPSHLQRIRRQLSSRDMSIISMLLLFRYASAIQLERLFFTQSTPMSNSRLSRRALKRLSDLQILQRIERRIGGVRAGSAGYVYSLDRAGYIIGTGLQKKLRRSHEPSLLFLNHILQVTELYVTLSESARNNELKIIAFDTEPQCWRPLPGTGRRYIKPDIFVVLQSAKYEFQSFIEIDMDTETMPRIDAKLRAYRAYWATGKEQSVSGLFPRVIFLVPTEARLLRITRQIERLPQKAQRLFGAEIFSRALNILVLDLNNDFVQRS